MNPVQLSVHFAFFSYGGNGGIAMEHPSIRRWFAQTLMACKADKRVGEITDRDYSDTPITMTRNEAVEDAQRLGADVLVMVDSDNHPDRELHNGDPTAKPFWASSFDFLHGRYTKGLQTVVGAPYCGPPPLNNVYVFRWANWNNYSPDRNIRVEQFSREEAAGRSGFEEVAALPTGLIMFDMRVFDLLEPPYFDYEWEGDGLPCELCGCRKPGPRAKKASTEDVVNTRDMALHAQLALKYNPVFCNWDAWAGHWKPLCVEKPKPPTMDQVSERYRNAVLQGRRSDSKLVILGEGEPEHPLIKAYREAHEGAYEGAHEDHEPAFGFRESED